MMMGVTVLAGAMTTAGAGAFLQPCQIIFFVKFSVLIMFTIFFSLMFANIFFMAGLSLFGPVSTFGDLPRCACLKPSPEEALPAPATTPGTKEP